MFLKFLKDFLIKRKLKKTLSNVKNNFSNDPIKTVGILIDGNYFNETGNLLNELVSNGIKKENILILVYKDKIRKNEVFEYPSFSMKNINWAGDFESSETKDFLLQNFDLLISYYDVEKAPLLLITQGSKASFKAGFATVDKKLNHFMINTVVENYKVFTDELFKYLKILNKI